MKRTIGNATLYCADNLEQLQDLSLPDETAVVTDPPYGIGSKTQHQTARRSKFTAAHDWTPIEGDDMPFDPTPWLRFKWVALFGANNFASHIPGGGSWLVWDKTPSRNNGKAELIWTSQKISAPTILRHTWDGVIRQGEGNVSQRGKLHPFEKPVEVMKILIQHLRIPTTVIILDPYMGSGSTAIAALDLGYRFVGIECVPEYFETACQRIEADAEHGRFQATEPWTPRPRKSGTSKEYIGWRLQKDHPQIYEEYKAGKYRSARQAGIAAGFIKKN